MFTRFNSGTDGTCMPMGQAVQAVDSGEDAYLKEREDKTAKDGAGGGRGGG